MCYGCEGSVKSMEEIFEMISHENNDKYAEFMAFIKEKKNISIYGAGGIGNITYNILKEKGCKVRYFIDDNENKVGKTIDNIEIVSSKDISIINTSSIIICVPCPMHIYEKLINEGCEDVYYFPIMMANNNFYDVSLIQKYMDKINTVYNLLADDISKEVFVNILKHRITMDFNYFNNIVDERQYFPNDLFKVNSNECFVDGGAYDGATTLDFIKECNGNFDYIYTFEPDKKNFDELLKKFTDIDKTKIKPYNAGLYSERGSVGFCNHGNSSSFVSSVGGSSVEVVKLDEVVNEHKPTFVKLDIEGSEREAIFGMKNTIVDYSPKLAISIYHKPNDLWDIPLQIYDINASYKIYIRHYLSCLNETVCYALKK